MLNLSLFIDRIKMEIGMMKKRNQNENMIYMFIWLLVLIMPVFTSYNSEQFNWTKVFLEWLKLLPFFLVFIVNNSLLLPKLLLPKKTKLYFLSVAITILLFSYLSNFSVDLHEMFLQPTRHMPPPHHRMPPPKPFSMLIIDKIIFSVLVVGFNGAVKLIIQRQKDDKKKEEKEKLHLATELSLLRQQISPHFIMNTLNNIHALIQIDGGKAQESVIQLSQLLRKLLSGAEEGNSTVMQELEFLESYIELMKLRIFDTVKVEVDFNVSEPDKKIPPLLFVSLVENAFKYGVSYTKKSYIFIKAKTEEGMLRFSVLNSKHSDIKKTGTGLGLKNLKKQLNLLYDDNFVFEINESDSEFDVKLNIPIYDNKLHSN